MKTFPLTTAAALLLLPLMGGAQEKSTLAIASIKPTPSLMKAVDTKAVTATQSGAKREVLVFDTKQELNRTIESLETQLADRLSATHKFDLVARADMAELLKEQDLGASGNLDSKTAARAGKVSGARYLLVATVDDFQDYIEKAAFEGTGQTATRRIFRLSLAARIYDSTTGKIVASGSFLTGNDEFKEIQKERDYSVKTGELNDAMLGAIARNMADKIAAKFTDAVYPAKVLAKRDNIVTINRGEGAGVAKGDVFSVFAQGEELIDPDTKEPLGREEVLVGKVRITQLGPKTSQAEILEDTGIDKGAVLRKAN